LFRQFRAIFIGRIPHVSQKIHSEVRAALIDGVDVLLTIGYGVLLPETGSALRDRANRNNVDNSSYTVLEPPIKIVS
jgi:hypothetical protein